MKIRNGFVSNSSSSSFIIQVKESIPCDKCGRKDQDIIDMIRYVHEHGDDDTSIDASGKGQIKAYVRENFLNLDAADVISKIDLLDEKDGKLYMVSISYGSIVSDQIEGGEAKNVKVIWGDRE